MTDRKAAVLALNRDWEVVAGLTFLKSCQNGMRFQIEISGVLSKPFGSYSTGEKAQDLFDLGGNAGVKLLFGMSRRFYLGAGVAYLRDRKDFTETAIMDIRPPAAVSGTRTLTAIPITGLAQVRSDTHRKLSGYVETGLGLTTFTWRLADFSDGREPDSDVQQTFSFLFGGGAVLALNRDWEVVAGLDYHHSIARGGEVWNTWDDPKFALLSLGVRYPRW